MDIVLQSHVLLASNPELLEENDFKDCNPREIKFAKHILSGDPNLVVEEVFAKIDGQLKLPNDIDDIGLVIALRGFLGEHFQTEDGSGTLLLAVALLQTFIQNNFTGPLAPVTLYNVLFPGEDFTAINKLLVKSLTSGGQLAYDLTDNPLYLILSLLLFEKLTNERSTFDNSLDNESSLPNISATTGGSLAIAHWWRARALLTHLSLLPEPSGCQPAIASSILSSIDLAHAITNDFPENVSKDVKIGIHTIFYLENVKCSLAIKTEHLCLQSLMEVKKLTKFEFVLTGARAKRTKFQQKAHTGLIILAKSFSDPSTQHLHYNSPESFALGSEVLLEKPYFESIASEPLDEQIIKKQKLDESGQTLNHSILPTAVRQENIPKVLQALDPNEQPQLTDYDDIQLLLRLYVIRQTTPAKDPLVEEELSAIISRVVYQAGPNNWAIYSRALWERSLVETTKAKTIERGLLQMQSLVEELDLKIQTKLIPQSDAKPTSRLKYAHQLPFIPRWELDATLAEKYMSLGVLRSAVEIYERLQMSCETALCYAAVGDEAQAKRVLQKRINDNPKDARAISILGDIMQDPQLWNKSWEIGKYVNAKNSLGRYYYNPPSNSGLTRDYDMTLMHLNDSLRQYSLNFETWYFYACVGLECGRIALAAEGFSRCVSLDETHAMAWSNLSAAYVQLGKLKEALSCLRKAVSSDAQKNWRIWENYMIVSVKLNEWNDVLLACKHLVNVKRERVGEGSIDLPVVEKLVELLVATEYDANNPETLTHYQKSCIDFICNVLPTVITTNARCWRLVARVELWRKRPWAALDCNEKAYRAISHNTDIDIDEKVWDETVCACEDLVAAYESLGELEGKHGSSSLVCKDWKYRSRATIKGLMGKGKSRWEDSDGWERLSELKKQL